MHSAIGVITKEKPTDMKIAEILAPFDENTEVEPYVIASPDEVKATMRDLLKYLDHDRDKKILEKALEENDINGFRYINEQLNEYAFVER